MCVCVRARVQMDAILDDLGVDDAVKDRFRQEKVRLLVASSSGSLFRKVGGEGEKK